MTGPSDDWDDWDDVAGVPEEGSGSVPYEGYRDGGAAWSTPTPMSSSRPSCTVVLATADMEVDRFCRRADVRLDLPDAVAACVHLIRQAGFLAASSVRMQREREQLEGWSQIAGDDLCEEFGPHLQDAMVQHGDVILRTWWLARTFRREG